MVLLAWGMQDGDRFWRMPEAYLRGNTIKYIRVPEEVRFLMVPQQGYCACRGCACWLRETQGRITLVTSGNGIGSSQAAAGEPGTGWRAAKP